MDKELLRWVRKVYPMMFNIFKSIKFLEKSISSTAEVLLVTICLCFMFKPLKKNRNVGKANISTGTFTLHI